MRVGRALAALAMAGVVVGCTNGTTPPVIDAGSGDINVNTAAPIDPMRSTVSVDRSMGVKADGTDKAMVTVKLVDGNGAPLPGIAVVLAAAGGDTIMGQPPVTDAMGVAVGSIASTRPGQKTVSALANPGPFAVALGQMPTVTFTAGSASKLVFTVQPASVPAGMNDPVSVQVQDALGNPVLDATDPITVAILSNPGGAQLGGATAKMPQGGVASFNLTVDKVGAGYTLIASTPKLGVAISAAFDVLGGPPAKLVFVSQPPSGQAKNTKLTPPVVVAVQDAAGNTIPGATNSITLTLGNNTTSATLGGTLKQNAVNGLATFNDLTVDTDGTYTLVAADPALPNASSQPFTVGGGPALTGTHLVFTMQPITSVAGSTLSVSVQVQDASNNVVTTATGPISLALLTNPGGATLKGTTKVNAVSGQASFMVSIDRAAQGYSLVAFANGATIGVSASFDIIAGAPSRVAFIAQPQSGKPTQVLTPPIQVAVEDSAGNILSGATNAITLALANAGSAKLSGTLTQNAVNGVATFGDLSVNLNGTYQLTASSGALAGDTSVSFNVGTAVGAASTLAFTLQPVTSTAGMGIPVTVQVQDSNGNLVTSANNSITLALFTNPGGAKLSGSTTIAAVNGVASFNVSVDKAGSNYSLVAEATGLSVAVSAAFNVTVGPASKLAFETQPPNGAPASALSPPVVVDVTDASGNLVTTASGTISLTLNNAGSATLSGGGAQTIVGGKATFNALTVSAAGTGYSLHATSTAVTATADSNSFNIATATGSSGNRLVFTTQPSSTTAGSAIAVTVQVQDGNGNVQTGATNAITISFFTNPGGATLTGGGPVNAVNGLASFNVSVNRAATGYSFVATAAGIQPGLSNAFDVSVGAASQLVFIQQPSTVAVGATMPKVQVAVEDAAGNIVTTATTSIALTLNPATQTLSGTTTRSASGGVATYSDLSVGGSGTFSLTATGGGFMVSSASFTVGSGSTGGASKLVFTVNPASTTAGATINVTVQVQDQNGNLVSSATNPISVALFTNPGGATLTGGSAVAASGGVANFSLTVNRPGSGYSLVATATGLGVGVSSAFDVAIGAPNKIAFVAQPTNAQSGAILAKVQVAIEDVAGNVVTVAPATAVSLTLNASNGAVLSGTTPVNTSSGVASFNDLGIGTVGTYTLTANATVGGGAAMATSASFSISSGPTTGAASKLAFVMQPSSITAGGSMTVTVQVQDSNSNPVNSATNTIALALVGGGNNSSGLSGAGCSNGTCSASANGTSGTASFTFNINSAGNGLFLVATSPGLSIGSSNSFNVAAGAAAKLVFLDQVPNAGVGSTLAPSFRVAVEDSAGNILSSSSASITLAFASATSATLGGTNPRAAAMGIATFNDITVSAAGTYTLVASATGLSNASSNSFQIGSASSGNGNRLVFTGQPATATAGQSINVTVQVQDPNGNLVSSATNAITLSLFTNPGGDMLGGTRTVNAVNGSASFSVSLTRAAQGYSLAATAAGLNVGVSVAFDITPAAEARISWLQQPPFSPTAGQTFNPSPTVAITDQFGNLVPTATDSITIALGNNMVGATLTGTKTQSAVMGVATFGGLSIDKRENFPGYTLVATATLAGTTMPVSATSISFNPTAGPTTQLVFSQQPVNVTAGNFEAISVATADQFGNQTNTGSGTVSLQLMSGSMAVGSPVTGTMNNGFVFFDVPANTAGTFTYVATLSGLSPATSNSFTVAVGMAARLSFVVQPTDTPVNMIINASLTPPGVQVGITDTFGNVVTTASGTIQVSVSGGGTVALGGTTTLSTSGGIANFNNLTLNRTGAFFLNAQTTTTPNFFGQSKQFNSLSGPPTKLVFTGQPFNASAGNNLFPQVSVEDAMGNIDPIATNAITLTISPTVTMNGVTNPSTPVNGQVNYNFNVTKAGTYTLTATATGLTQAVSNPFTVSGAQAVALAFTVQPSNAKTYAAIAPAVTVSEVDQFGNVAGFGSGGCFNVTLSIKPATAALLGQTNVQQCGTLSGTFNVGTDRTGTFQLVATDTSGATMPLPPVTSTSFTVSAGAWTPINSGLDAGDITALVIDPSTSGATAVLYAGTNGGGVYKSTDGGTTWTQMNNFLGNVFITSLAVHPTTTSTVFAGTSNGLYKSTDGGATWSQTSLVNKPCPSCGTNAYSVSSVTFAPSAPSTMFVTSPSSSTARSTDGGSTWTVLNSFGSGNVVAVDPTNANIVYLGGNFSMQKSTDGGTCATASNCTNASSGLNGSVTGIAILPATPTTLYASTTAGFYISTNGAGQWNASNTGMTATQLGTLALSKNTPSTLYTATQFAGTPSTIQVYTSTNSGASWTAITNGGVSNRPSNVLAIDPTTSATVYSGTGGGGVFKTTNSGTAWSAATTGISAGDVRAVVATSSTNLLAAVRGAGIYASTNGGTSWAQTAAQPADPFIQLLATAPSNAQQLYTTGPISDVYLSSNGGTTWTQPTTPPTQQVLSFAVHPTVATTAYAGCSFGVFRTTDGGVTWASIGSNASQVNAVIVDRVTPNATIYIGHSSGFDVGTFNSGTMTWSFSSNGLGLNNASLLAAAQGPQAAGDFFTGGNLNVFHSSSLPNWTAALTLTNQGFTQQFNAIAFDPNTAGTVYAGGLGAGVYASSNDGSSFSYAGSGLYNSDIQSLAHDPSAGASNLTLFAGTRGAGMWKTTTGGL